MYKVFLRFPEALRPAFPRLKEKLEDPDPGKFQHFESPDHSIVCTFFLNLFMCKDVVSTANRLFAMHIRS